MHAGVYSWNDNRVMSADLQAEAESYCRETVSLLPPLDFFPCGANSNYHTILKLNAILKKKQKKKTMSMFW